MRMPRILGFLILGGQMAGAADQLIVGDPRTSAEPTSILPLAIAGTSPVTALQFDVEFTASLFNIGPAVAVTETNHRADSRLIAENRRRVVLYSRSNAVLAKDVILDLPVSALDSAGGNAPQVRVVNICFTLADGTRVIPTVKRGEISQWFADFFNATEMDDPLVISDTADPDGDGLSNLVEYGIGGHPRVAERALAPRLAITIDPVSGQPRWTFLYRQSRLATGVTFAPETSQNLLNWVSATAFPTGVEDSQSIEYRVTLSSPQNPTTFFRLGISRSQ